MMCAFWFLMGLAVGVIIAITAFEKTCKEFDDEVTMYHDFIKGARARIEVIDETSKK